MKDYKNILIIRTDRIGDVVLTTPAIASLRQAYSQARISILVKPDTVDLVRGNPYLDEILVDDRTQQHRGPWGFGKLVNQLRRRKFDLAVIFHTKKRTNALCFFAGIPQRVGYCDKKFGFLLTHKIPDVRHQGLKHEAQYCLDVCQYLGVEVQPARLFLPLQPECERWAEELFVRQGLNKIPQVIAFHMGASDPAKMWPVNHFAQLMNFLDMIYVCHIVLVGAHNVRALAKEALLNFKGHVLDLTGQTSVGQLVSVLKRCTILISNDSGPVHVADALGVPVVSIFLRDQPGINAERWRPLGEKSRAIKASPDSQILKPEEVLRAVDATLKLC